MRADRAEPSRLVVEFDVRHRQRHKIDSGPSSPRSDGEALVVSHSPDLVDDRVELMVLNLDRLLVAETLFEPFMHLHRALL